jgi:hypothetical protein
MFSQETDRHRTHGKRMNELIRRSPQQITIVDLCANCENPFPLDDNKCRFCGHSCHPSTSVQRVTVASPSNLANRWSADRSDFPLDAVLNNRLLVIGAIAMFGPLGFPALWFSPRFSAPIKIVTTVVYVMVTTIIPLAIIWYWLDYSLWPLVEAFSR